MRSRICVCESDCCAVEEMLNFAAFPVKPDVVRPMTLRLLSEAAVSATLRLTAVPGATVTCVEPV